MFLGTIFFYEIVFMILFKLPFLHCLFSLWGFALSILMIAPSDVRAEQIIEHAMGKTVIAQRPQRVVTLFQGATDTAVALGITPVGIVESWTQKPVYNYLRAPLKDVELVGLETQPNLEKLVALKPDLIIAAKFRHETLYNQLSAIAPVIYLEEIFHFKRTVKLMGQALFLQKRAERLLSQWHKKVNHFRKVVSSRKQTDWPVETSLINFRADHLRLLSRRSFPGSILSELGFKHNAQADTKNWIYKKITSKEALPTINADTFFVFLRDTQPAITQNYTQWRKHPLWRSLKAPRKNNVHDVDGIVWSLSGGILGANMVLDDLYRIYGLSEQGNAQ